MSTPLDLFGEITTADGTKYKIDANQSAGSRPQNLSFRTKIGDGFADGSFQLARLIDRDYEDLGLVNDVTFTGADGSVAYEGRIAEKPIELADRHMIGVSLAGWMSHTRGKRFVMPFVDRNAGNWGEMPRERKSLLGTAGISFADFSYSSGQGGIIAGLPNQALGALTIAEAWYQAPTGIEIAYVGYRGKTTTLPGGYTQTFFTTTTRDATAEVAVASTLDDTLRLATIATPTRYVAHRTYSSSTVATPASGSSTQLSKVAAYGNHGLTLRTGDPSEPDGVYASDVLRWIVQNICPKINTDGVVNSDYVIQHLAFNDPIYPFDAFLEVNKYHLWHLGVWDNRTLHFRPYDLTDYDWEIRTDDPGTTFTSQGPSTENLFNGITVTYTDPLTGVTDRLIPAAYGQLSDTSSTNPWNKHGEDHWDDITLSSPTTLASALNIGTAALADRNRPRTPGTITVRGYIRDRAGNKQPVWKVRAGDTISITNFPNDTPRLIVETDYDDEAKSIRLAIDRPFALLDAYLDRIGNALSARGIA
jgi:hypothetical protein